MSDDDTRDAANAFLNLVRNSPLMLNAKADEIALQSFIAGAQWYERYIYKLEHGKEMD